MDYGAGVWIAFSRVCSLVDLQVGVDSDEGFLTPHTGSVARLPCPDVLAYVRGPLVALKANNRGRILNPIRSADPDMFR